MSILKKHEKIETNATLLFVFAFLAVTVGGLVQIVPQFYLDNVIEDVEGVRPYTPLELAGSEIYDREGCYGCHSQMIRTMRDEVQRYGHYSLAAESQYDRPFRWGSKRTGPDLARVGGKYSDEWHVDHLVNPQAVVPESVMPRYAHLLETPLDIRYIDELVNAHRLAGTPYTKEQVASANRDAANQANPDSDYDSILENYPGAIVRNFDGQAELTEMDALVAYLQILGTMVDFSTFEPDASR